MVASFPLLSTAVLDYCERTRSRVSSREQPRVSAQSRVAGKMSPAPGLTYSTTGLREAANLTLPVL